MKSQQLLKNYKMGITNTDVSPFEFLETLQIRSILEKGLNKLSMDEKLKLYSYDLSLIQNADKMSSYLCEIYDFRNSKEQLSEWWWHLDKVASGEIQFSLNSHTQSEYA